MIHHQAQIIVSCVVKEWAAEAHDQDENQTHYPEIENSMVWRRLSIPATRKDPSLSQCSESPNEKKV